MLIFFIYINILGILYFPRAVALAVVIKYSQITNRIFGILILGNSIFCWRHSSPLKFVMNTATPKMEMRAAHHASLGTSIAVAEAVSSAASLGSVWLIGNHPGLIQPIKEFVAKQFIYPRMCQHAAEHPDPLTPEDPAELMKRAEQKASVLLKGIIMVGTTFATHIPTQMMLEGRHDAKEFKKVVLGKSLGLATAMGTLAVINAVKPGMVDNFENQMSDKMFHCKETDPSDNCEKHRELFKLMMIDLPSSVVAGLMNYQLTRRL